ncbi:MAG: polyprenyl synthetase family protein [Candidatus Marinimicrobia bacterium]|jgi:geranylgeranyl pyrophosphate synthase|nr:polyprenyl synthetase family protein [Candidatus Neomarinimicrobiota bacterium]MBT3500834.1 polyprenyl synthetase family protein [Candidatus Neomarinimicrobiota bacterium]MBT3838868.1 polyprenyl synthetase family protein [Candidatus Neomarinimicrobiota bacterium]MBT3998845.1 polyprenyl synthetase family protein [Candidatus Neomarinimicrobiota bacterium]MBT4282836.1 polyprenyl synthetase family protein [Candidatus Neomarinimicrobiota bacterium]
MPSFNELVLFIRKEVNQDLRRLPIPEKPAYLYDPIRFTLRGTGKRFRPILVHLSGRANNADPDSLMKIALAVELLHNFTLVHDDIMDNDDTRHGQPAIHFKWDDSTAILAGDGINAIAQILLSGLPYRSNAICRSFNQATLEVCEGQAYDKEFENDLSITENQYLEMIEKKTGSLLGASANLPAILIGADPEVISYFDQFGRALGNGFQIHDDLLEIYGNVDDMGKSLGSDIAEGKQTMMVIKARNKFKKEWENLISDPNSPELMSEIRNFFQDNGIKEETKAMAKSYFDSARDILDKINGIDKNELIDFVNLVENRTY